MFTHRLLPFLGATIATSLALSAQEVAPSAPRPPQSTAGARTAPAPAPVAPPADPFVRDPRALKSSDVPAPAAAVAPVNLLTTVETWSLSEADFVALLDGPADERAPYDRIEELAKAGKAKLVGLMALTQKSGQRVIGESIDEVRYAVGFRPAERAGEIALPTSWETRNTGETIELEPVLGSDGRSIDISLASKTVRLAGFEDWKLEAAAAPLGQPKFHTETVTTSARFLSGRPGFLSTPTPAVSSEPQPVKEMRIQALRITAQVPPPPAAPVPACEFVRLEFLLYTLGRATAQRILLETGDSAQSHAAVRELVAKGEAQIEVVRAFLVKGGQRAVSEQIAEIRYPSTGTPPSLPATTALAEGRRPASFRAFETRNTGVTIEVETVIDPDGRFVHLNIVPQVVRLAGVLKVEGVAAKYPPQPVFTTRKISTSAISGLGVPVLLGTMSQPSDTGVNDRKDGGQTSLAYIRVTPVRP